MHQPSRYTSGERITHDFAAPAVYPDFALPLLTEEHVPERWGNVARDPEGQDQGAVSAGT